MTGSSKVFQRYDKVFVLATYESVECYLVCGLRWSHSVLPREEASVFHYFGSSNQQAFSDI